MWKIVLLIILIFVRHGPLGGGAAKGDQGALGGVATNVGSK